MKRAWILAMTAIGVVGVMTRACSPSSRVSDAPKIERRYIGPETSLVAFDSLDSESRACEGRLQEVLAQPAVPGAPDFDAQRVRLLATAKAEPVIFTKAPEYEDTEDLTPRLKAFRRLLTRSNNPWGIVGKLLSENKGRPFDVRAMVLKEGYIYADTPDLAYAYVSLLKPQDLFGHDQIWVQRGERVLHAERRRGQYYFTDGPLEGEVVRLLHMDRIGAENEPGPPLHRDVRSLMYRMHFDRMKIRHVTDSHIVANLRYGRWWVPTVLVTDGARVDLECEVMSPSLRMKVEEARRENRRRSNVVQALRQTMLAQVDEGLPFDEPHHEYGHQLDGKLRRNWSYAYMMKRPTYAFNGDRYLTFDQKGRPHVPQVCVDFLTDTFERFSGTWYKPRGEKPERVVGRLDFDAIPDVDRVALRRVPDFIEFAKTRTDWFDVYDTSPNDRLTRLGKPERFYPFLEAHSQDFQPGDILVIRGKTPWDRRHVHYHSFFVYEMDPLTGVPLIVTGNAGKPSLRSWETEARRTPKRSIHHRLRPRTEWLEALLTIQPTEEPLSLSTSRD